MAPARRRGSGRAATAAAAAARQWEVGDLVLAKMKGFPAWPAAITDPEKWGYSSNKKKVLVYFFGTKQIAFCNYVDIEAFTEEKKKVLLSKRHGKGSDFVRALDEIIDNFDKFQKQKLSNRLNSIDDEAVSDSGNFDGSSCKSSVSPKSIVQENAPNHGENGYKSDEGSPLEADGHPDLDAVYEDSVGKVSILDELRQTPFGTATVTTWGKRSRDAPLQICVSQKRASSLRRSRKSLKVDSVNPRHHEKPLGREISSNALDAAEPDCVAGKKFLSQETDSVFCPNLDRTISSIIMLSNDADKNVVSEPVALNTDHAEVKNPLHLKYSPIDEQVTSEYLERNNVYNGEIVIHVEDDIFKKMNTPWKKELCEDLSSHPTLNEEAKSHSFFQRNSLSPFSCTKTNGSFLKADGDEHLPLVKRARARMRGPIEDGKLDQVIVRDSIDKEVSSSAVDKDTTLANVNCIKDTTLSMSSVNKMLLNDCTQPQNNHTILPSQLKGGLVDSEAALPPSKRLHRALEAMSANVAEAKDNDSEAVVAKKIMANGCIDSSCEAIQVPTDNMEPSLEDSDHMKQIDCAEVSNCEIEMIPNSASNVSVESPERRLEMDSGNSCIFENKGIQHTSCGKTSCFSSEVASMPADKIAELEVVSENHTCPEEKKTDISLGSIVTKASSSITEAVKASSSKKGLGSAEGSAISSAVEKSEQKSLSLEAANARQDSVVKSIGSLSLNSTDAMLSVSPAGLTEALTSESTKSSSSVSSRNIGTNSVSQVGSETKQIYTMKDLSFSPELTPMKVLIAAAQAKRLHSRSSSRADSVIDARASSDNILSPSPYFRAGSTDRFLTHNGKADYAVYSRSPDPSISFRNSAQQMESNDQISDLVHKESLGLSKYNEHEADAAFKSFETQLHTLTRAKESIARATRRAIDCAKHNIANEVVKSIVICLEKEPSLHRRVDMFFLVDSITRTSRGQTCTVGDVFISLLLPILPRLLSAAAPPGISASENRRQCLKVLRLWLERRTFPESIIRHHIREIESISEPSLSTGFSRRPSRTERALDDPVREMEGMLVDEYGSNTGFHLPGLLASRVTNDEEDGSDTDDKIFEAVTPERHPLISGIVEANAIAEKHKHILEDVDGELEMEDVAPYSEIVASTSLDAGVVEKQEPSSYHFGLHTSIPFAPPLPEERPPSPPPLPCSPPPVPPNCAVDQDPSTSNPNTILTGTSHPTSTENHFSCTQNPRSEGQNIDLKSEPVPYYAPAYRDFPNLPPAVVTLRSSYYANNSSSLSSTNSGMDNLPVGSGTPTSNAYFLQPPPAMISNQFSYMHTEPQHPIANPVQFGNDTHSGNCYSTQSPRRAVHERSRLSSVAPSGSLFPENTEVPSSHPPYFCQQPESSPAASQSWNHPSMASGYAYSGHPSRPSGNSFPQMAGASGHWRPQ